MNTLLEQTIAAIQPLDVDAMQQARARQESRHYHRSPGVGCLEAC